jgi:uncharacterized protein involved in exopolysaccharide biosynthesis
MSVAVIPSSSSAIGPARRSNDYHPYTLRDLLTAVFYHRRVMFIAFLVPVLLGFAAALLTKPAFVAQARLLVLYGSEYFYQPVAAQPGGGVALDRNEIMEGELQVLQSTTLALDTLQAVGVDRVYPGTRVGDRTALDRAALRMAHDLTATAIPQSNVLELSFRSYDPDVAAAVLRAVISGYLERRAAIFQRTTANTAPADQAAFLARLHQAEDALGRFADAHGIANIDQQISLLVQQQAANSQARNDAAQAISETTASLAAIRTQLQHVPQALETYADSDRSQTSRVLTETLARLQVKRRDLVSRYQDSFPLVEDVDRQIAALQAQIAQAPAREDAVVRSGVNPVYQNGQAQLMTLSTQLAGLQARAAQLAATATALDAQLIDLNQSARQYRDLLRNRDLLDDAYRTLARSYEAAQIADTAERSRAANIRVVQPPERPVASRNLRTILLAGGVLVGLLAALAALAVANSLKQVFVSVRDANVGLDLPVLAAVARRPGSLPPSGKRYAVQPARRIKLLAQRVLGV